LAYYFLASSLTLIVYTFPLDVRAAVSGFEIVTGDRKLKGEVKKSADAAADYDDAVSAGHGAYLLEQETGEMFRISVGNLAPGWYFCLCLFLLTANVQTHLSL